MVTEFDEDVTKDSSLQLVNCYGQNLPLVKLKKASNAQIMTCVYPEKTKLCQECAGSLIEMLGKGRCWLAPELLPIKPVPAMIGGFERKR